MERGGKMQKTAQLSNSGLAAGAFTAEDPLPARVQLNGALQIERLPKHLDKYFEIKDPSVVALPNGTYMMYASVGNSVEQRWLVGRFLSTTPEGPWKELEPVIFKGIDGPQLCAPAVMYEEVDGKPLWKMYIQTACFQENGVIALATSDDGHTFYGHTRPLATKDSIVKSPVPVIGVYDVGVSEVKNGQEDLLCMIYSGYRRIGCGDLYMSTRHKSAPEEAWSPAQMLLQQEDVPFHNRPDYEHFEWGLEGAKLIQLADDHFLLIGVCFMPRPKEYDGTRQRVFFATADSMNGPFTPISMPFTPEYSQWQAGGENGHPDTLIVGDHLWVIYQERTGVNQPWYLRCAQFNLNELSQVLKDVRASQSAGQENTQSATQTEETVVSNNPNFPYV
jgi:hypothetical protein